MTGTRGFRLKLFNVHEFRTRKSVLGAKILFKITLALSADILLTTASEEEMLKTIQSTTLLQIFR